MTRPRRRMRSARSWKAGGHARLVVRPRLVDGLEKDLEVTLHRARRHVRLGLVVIEQQADCVALLEHEVRQCSRQRDRVAKFAQRCAGRKVHGAGHVEQQIGFEVGLLFVLFDVQAVGFGVCLPIEVAQGVARHVGTVLGKFDREAVVRAAVQAGDKALDHEPRNQVEAREARDGFRVEIGGGFAHARILAPRRRAGVRLDRLR